MRKSEHYCPFLNKGELICGEHFSLSGVGHALKHCFAEYERCKAFTTLNDALHAGRAAGEAEGATEGAIDVVSGQSCDSSCDSSCQASGPAGCQENPAQCDDQTRAFPRRLVEVTITPGLLQRLRAP